MWKGALSFSGFPAYSMGIGLELGVKAGGS